MKHLMISLGLALGLSACATYGDNGYGYGGGYAYNGYYDNYYGPVYDGYWGDGDLFYYRTVRNGPYLRDDSRHFRRDTYQGYREFRVRGPRQGDNDRRDHRDRDDRDRHHRDHDRDPH